MTFSPPYLLLPLLLATAGAHAAPLTYTCADGRTLTVTFGEAADGRPQAIIHRADSDLVLPQVVAASGARYYAAPVELHTKGNEAFYDDGSGQALHCSHNTPAATSNFITLAGSVSYRSRNALPPTAILHIRVEDVAGKPTRVLAEQRYELNGAQVPIPFTATIDRHLLGQRARVQVAARIEIDGKTRYVNAHPSPAMKDSQPLPLAIELKPVASAKR
ncbi:YbaY family lipoprotein [Azonexus sp.]|jgi:putative lipoprotein|uniref:YbaY family lipoprotein n=1 Tax=Azonexus sp. TaxID=1872668 RepID=UPI002821FD4F|nr:YbaY family lipoprotein [Azonexus sp.]MDR1995303.1 YbaY family lipoprotein [Azonexus sp.]